MAKKFVLAIQDLNGNRLCTLQDSTIEQNGAAHDISISKETMGWKEIQFTISCKDADGNDNYRWDYLKNENLVHLWEDNYRDVYCIKVPKEIHEASKMQIVVACNHISEELKTKNLYKYFDDDNGIDNCENLIRAALKGSGWKLIACDTFLESDGVTEKVRSYSCDTKTGSFNMINEICALFDARPIFHGYDRTVEIKAKSNTDGYMEVLFGKNADKIHRTPDSSNIVTRLYVEGEYGDFGYVGIDEVNPTGLPFILNFDYYKELGLFTDEHQAIVDKYLIDYKTTRDAISTDTAENLKKERELTDLIGEFSQALYTVADGEIVEDSLIKGFNTANSDATIHDDDLIVVVQEDGKYEYIEYQIGAPLQCVYAIKFVPAITGSLAALEDIIKASEKSKETYLEKLNKFLRKNNADEIAIEDLYTIYGTDDLNIVGNEDFDLSGIEEEIYKNKTVLEYVSSIGKSINSIEDNEKLKNDSMLNAIQLMKDIDALNITIAQNQDLLDTINDDFAIAMGTMLRDGYYSDTNYVPGQEQSLQNDSVEISKQLAYPKNKYDINILNLSRLDKYADEEFKLAQAIRIYDDSIKINDHGIVSKIIIYPDNPKKDNVQVETDLLNIGNKTFASILERVTQLAEQVRINKDVYKRAAVISKEGMFDTEMLQGSIDVMRTQLLSSASNWKTDEKGNVLFESLDGLSAMMLCGNGFMIANSKTESGAWDWSTFGTGDGFSADMITTGFLSASRIEAGTITVEHLESEVGKNLDISSNESITMVAGKIDEMDETVRLAEQKMTPEGICTMVQESSGTENDIAKTIISADSIKDYVITEDNISEHVMTAEEIVDTVKSDDEVSTAIQESGKIAWIIQDGEDSSTMTLTDDAVNVISESINLNASEQFNVLVGDVNDVYTKQEATSEKISWIIESGESSSEMVLTEDMLNATARDINLKVNNEFNVIAENQKWFTFNKDGLIICRPAYIDEETGETVPTSIWSTVTDETGYHIRNATVPGYVGSFYKDRLKVDTIEMGDTLIRKMDDGGIAFFGM